MQNQTRKLKLRLIIDVEYDLNGERESEMKEMLHSAAGHINSEGMFTGSSTAEVASWDYRIVESPKTPLEAEH